MAQFEPASNPSEDPFHRPYLQQPSLVFVEGNTNKHKFFKIDRFFKKRIVRKGKDLTIKYLVC